jgi:dolichol kinase
MKMVMELATYWRRRSGTRTRQLIHVALSSWIGFWPLFDVSDWSWRLNVLVPAVVGTRYLYKAIIQKNPTDAEVINMSRTSSPWDLIYGPLQLTILMVWLGLTQFMQPEAAILLAAVGIGDGLAPLIGRRYGRHLYCMPMAKPKSMEGSVCGVFLGTIAGCYLYPYLLGMDWFPLRIVLAYGGIAAVVEGVSPSNLDNILVPLVLYFSIDKVDRWMPA